MATAEMLIRSPDIVIAVIIYLDVERDLEL